MVNQNAIAIIPARGGSKRIPHKNIIEFCGKPMIAWTIEAAKQTGLFKRVLVSTDSPEIAEVAKSYGADVPFLREEAAHDHAPISEATLAALSQAETHWQETYTTVVQLMANCPLRRAPQISDALTAFHNSQTLFQLSCIKFGWMNPWWAAKLDTDNHPAPLFPEALKQRSQDLDDLYCPVGAIWIAQTEALRHSKTFYGPDHRYHPMHWVTAIDIDDYDDLNMAKALSTLDG